MPVDQIKTDDLGLLRNVAEGWYVDYKRDEITPKDYGKQLCAFANQNGGYLFLGVDEDSETRRASSFPGIPREQIAAASEKIRNANLEHVQPKVTYEARVFDGPSCELSLPSDRAIILILIRKGIYPPYVHSSGKIYMRVDDASEPCKELRDRHELQRLIDRGRRFEAGLKRRFRETGWRENKDAPRMYLHFLPDPLEELASTEVTLRGFKESLERKRGAIRAQIPYDTYYGAPGGFAARQVAENDPTGNVLMVRWWLDGSAMFDVPVNWKELQELRSARWNYPCFADFLNVLGHSGYRSGALLDLSYVAGVTAAAGEQFLSLCDYIGTNCDLFGKIRLKNADGMIPFVNSSRYVAECKEFGVPFIHDNDIWYPAGFDLSSLQKLGRSSQGESFGATATLVLRMLHATGVVRNAETAGEIYTDSILHLDRTGN